MVSLKGKLALKKLKNKMAKIYINYHPNYTYSMAIIDGFIDLREYVYNTDWLCWAPSPKNQRQIMISRVRDVPEGEPQIFERVNEFVKHVEQIGVEVLVRNERNEKWLSWDKFLKSREEANANI